MVFSLCWEFSLCNIVASVPCAHRKGHPFNQGLSHDSNFPINSAFFFFLRGQCAFVLTRDGLEGVSQMQRTTTKIWCSVLHSGVSIFNNIFFLKLSVKSCPRAFTGVLFHPEMLICLRHGCDTHGIIKAMSI